MKRLFSRTSLALALTLWAILPSSAEELRVAVGLALPPYVIEQEDKGIEVDILREALPGYSIKLMSVPMIRIPLSLSEDKADAALTINESSGLQKVFYSDTHITYQNVAITLKSSNLKIASIEDLSGLTVIGFQHAQQYLGPQYASVTKSNPNYKELGMQDSQVKMLFAERADVIIMDINIFKYFLKQIDPGLVDVSKEFVVHEIFPPTFYKVGFKSEETCKVFNANLEKLRSSGKYDQILNKYIE